jgi:REP-associated tyrosine transposase
MDDYESLSHTKWECKYHVVFIPKRRRKTIDGHPAEIRRVAGDRVYQGKECDPPGPGVRRKEAEFRGSALLGQRVLRLDRRSRRSRDTGVRSGGRSARATQPVALIDHLQVVKEMGAASATPNSRFERLTHLKPPALPGDTYLTAMPPRAACADQ